MDCCLQSISKINGGVGVVVGGDSIHLWVEGRISRGGLTDSCPPNVMVGLLLRFTAPDTHSLSMCCN